MQVLQSAIQHQPGKGNAQAMSSGNPQASFNFPVRVLRWREEVGGAIVEMLFDLPEADIRAGQVFEATLRPNPRVSDARQQSFLTHRKRGLRTGGIVLLRRMTIDAPEVISARELEVLLLSPQYGSTYFSQNAAVSICPPPPGLTQVVKEGYIALLNLRVPIGDKPGVKATDVDIEKAFNNIGNSLELARSFGSAGLILTGAVWDAEPNADGELEYDTDETLVGGSGATTKEAIIASLKDSPNFGEIANDIKASHSRWYLIPFFKGAVDPERSGRLSGMRSNLQYGEGDALNWTACNAILRRRANVDQWTINDVTPPTEAEARTEYLLNLIEEYHAETAS